MDLKLTPEVLRSFRDKDSSKERFRSLYDNNETKQDFLTAYAKHTDLRVQDDPKWAIGRGDEWESHGKMQLAFLCKEGLRPDSMLLDVGCGVGRGARKFVPYLNTGKYIGIDISPAALAHAQQLAVKEGWVAKLPIFMLNSDLDIDYGPFNFIFAHSVFTHLPEQQIDVMIGNAAKILADKASFFFTYKPAPKSHRSGLKQFQHSRDFLVGLGEKHGLLGNSHSMQWPAGQRTIRLTKK